MKLEHIGIAVKNLGKSNDLFRQLLGKEHYKIEAVESENVKTSFFQTGESKIELLEASSEDSAIAKYIEKRGEGIHHIAFEVEDIYAEMKRLADEGFRILNEKPKRGADNKLVCFIHPKSANGVLVELCQSISTIKKLNAATFENWLQTYFKAWEEGNAQLVTDTFAENGAYNVTPFTDNLKGKAEIFQYWGGGTKSNEEVESTTNYQIISVKDNVGFAKWQAQFNKKTQGVIVRLDGTMEVIFDEELKVKTFNEWWHREEEKLKKMDNE